MPLRQTFPPSPPPLIRFPGMGRQTATLTAAFRGRTQICPVSTPTEGSRRTWWVVNVLPPTLLGQPFLGSSHAVDLHALYPYDPIMACVHTYVHTWYAFTQLARHLISTEAGAAPTAATASTASTTSAWPIIAAVHSSDLRRAVETADIIAGALQLRVSVSGGVGC